MTAGVDQPVDVDTLVQLGRVVSELADEHGGCHWFYVSTKVSPSAYRSVASYLSMFAKTTDRLVARFEVPAEHGHCWVFDAMSASYVLAMEGIATTRGPATVEIARGFRPAVL